ncbi:MAG TPA: DNA repair protein RecO [Chloroflexota bacterium]|jgi:DNA repair protein RecO (recombination protein O)|nr:DNA repair protein RecO [Chloroflexota bacterium]
MRRVRLYQTDAIVLRRHNLGEADRILTLYSREHGKLRAIAKGVRRPQSRLAGHVELFSLTHFQLAVGRDLDVVTQAEAREPFRQVRAALERTSEAYYALELVDRLTPERLENRALFELLCTLLHGLNAPRAPQLARSWFALHALAALGYRPQLTACVACAAPIMPGANYFAPLAGGVLCPTCGPSEPAARAIPVDVLKVLRYLQRTPELGQVRLTVAPALRGAVEGVLRTYIEPLVERHLATETFLDRLRRDPRLHPAAPDAPALAGGAR